MGATLLIDHLKNKPVQERAAWYRVAKDRHPNKRWHEYFLEKDEEILHQLNQIQRLDREEKKKIDGFLSRLKDEMIEEIRGEIEKIPMLVAINGERLVEWGASLGAILAVDLKMAQIRRLLGAMMRIEASIRSGNSNDFRRDDVEYLRIYLAYAAGRKKEVRPLLAVLDPMIRKVRKGSDGKADFQQIVRFVRAIVAYHKFYGGAE